MAGLDPGSGTHRALPPLRVQLCPRGAGSGHASCGGLPETVTLPGPNPNAQVARPAPKAADGGGQASALWKEACDHTGPRGGCAPAESVKSQLEPLTLIG